MGGILMRVWFGVIKPSLSELLWADNLGRVHLKSESQHQGIQLIIITKVTSLVISKPIPPIHVNIVLWTLLYNYLLSLMHLYTLLYNINNFLLKSAYFDHIYLLSSCWLSSTLMSPQVQGGTVGNGTVGLNIVMAHLVSLGQFIKVVLKRVL